MFFAVIFEVIVNFMIFSNLFAMIAMLDFLNRFYIVIDRKCFKPVVETN